MTHFFEVSRGSSEGGAPIGTQHLVGRQNWPQNLADFLSAHRFEHEIGGAAHAVARNEYGNLFKRQPTLGSLAAAPARCTGDPPTLALAGAKEIRLVRLSDADQRQGLHGLGQRQETMAPAKSPTLGNMEPLTDLTQAQPVSQGFSLPQPLIAQMQMRQGRSGQRIKGAIAVLTPEPLQGTMTPMLDGMSAGAVRTLSPCRRLCLGCTRLHRRQFGGNGRALLAR